MKRFILMCLALFLFDIGAVAANQDLCNELSLDPLGRGYASMSLEEKVTDINSVYRPRWLPCVEGAVLLDAIDSGDWTARTEAQRDRALAILSLGCLDPQQNARTLLIGIFGAGTTTISNMAALSQETISRAVELGLSRVRAGDIQGCGQ